MFNDLVPAFQGAFLFLYSSTITTLNSFLSSNLHCISHEFLSLPILFNVDYAGHRTRAGDCSIPFEMLLTSG